MNPKLREEVAGAYEVLVKTTLRGRAQLKNIGFETITQLNSKTQPSLNIGKNTIYVGAGDPTESIVVWPELQGGKAAPYIVEQHNVIFAKTNPGYMGTLHAEKPKEDAWVVFRVDAPRDITRINYGGRFYNREPNSHIDLLHSFDGGKAWLRSYSLTDTNQPWDVIHYETLDRIAPGTRSVLFKYLLNGSAGGSNACSIYVARIRFIPETPLEARYVQFQIRNQRIIDVTELEVLDKIELKPFDLRIALPDAVAPVIRQLISSTAIIRAFGYRESDKLCHKQFTVRRDSSGGAACL